MMRMRQSADLDECKAEELMQPAFQTVLLLKAGQLLCRHSTVILVHRNNHLLGSRVIIALSVCLRMKDEQRRLDPCGLCF
jgi:hypothetical protein